MAKRLAIPSKELALTIVGPINSYRAARIQRVGLDNTIPINDIDELGDSRHAGTTLGTATVTLSFQSMDVSTALFGVLAGVSGAYPAAGRDIQYLGEIDAILKVKDAITSQYAKTAHAKRLQIRDFAFNYSVDGDSTEEYTAIGSEKRWFKWDVIVDKFTTGTTSFTLSYMPLQLKNGNKLLTVILDGGYLTETSGVPTTGQYSVSGNVLTTADTRTAQVMVVYHANTGGLTTWTDVSDTVNPAAVRGRDVKIYIGVNNINRVQTVTVNGNLRPEAVNELGSRTVVGYQRQVPTVEGQLTVLDTDTELIELLTTGQVNVSGVVEYVVGENPCLISGVSLEIKLIDPCDITDPFTVIKTIYIPSITIAGDNFTSNVNGNAQQVFNWRSTDAQCIIYSGAR